MSHSVIVALCAFLIASHLEWLRLNNLFSCLPLPSSVLVCYSLFSRFVVPYLSLSLSLVVILSLLLTSLRRPLSTLTESDEFDQIRLKKKKNNTNFCCEESMFVSVSVPADRTPPPHITHSESAWTPASPQITPPINNLHPTTAALLQLPRFIVLTLIAIPQQQMHAYLLSQMLLSC